MHECREREGKLTDRWTDKEGGIEGGIDRQREGKLNVGGGTDEWRDR